MNEFEKAELTEFLRSQGWAHKTESYGAPIHGLTREFWGKTVFCWEIPGCPTEMMSTSSRVEFDIRKGDHVPTLEGLLGMMRGTINGTDKSQDNDSWTMFVFAALYGPIIERFGKEEL